MKRVTIANTNGKTYNPFFHAFDMSNIKYVPVKGHYRNGSYVKPTRRKIINKLKTLEPNEVTAGIDRGLPTLKGTWKKKKK
jgi:hypothetical protein